MRKHLQTAGIVLLVSLGVSTAADAQTFKVEKFDIKGDGGTDYVAVEPATGRVFVSRATHMMVVEGPTGKVLGDIPNTPGVHGAGIATKVGHGFTTNGGDETVTMFDLKTLAVIKQIKVGPGLDGIMYDEPDDKIILTNHSRPIGTLTAIDPTSGDIVATVELEDTAPEGAAADGKGHIFVNNEGKNTIQVIDVKTSRPGRRPPRGRLRLARARRASRMTRHRIASFPVATRPPSSLIQTPAKSWQLSPTARALTPWDGIR
jgi:DNA-binding beta-propeller fold protein YncE